MQRLHTEQPSSLVCLALEGSVQLFAWNRYITYYSENPLFFLSPFLIVVLLPDKAEAVCGSEDYLFYPTFLETAGPPFCFGTQSPLFLCTDVVSNVSVSCGGYGLVYASSLEGPLEYAKYIKIHHNTDCDVF